MSFPRPTHLSPLLAVLALLVFAGVRTSSLKASEGAAQLRPPAVRCSAGTAQVSFSWTPVTEAQGQWLDLTLADNGFEPGSFLGLALPASAATFSLDGVLTGAPHLWRLNTLTIDGWVTSATGAFVACGEPALLANELKCLTPQTAQVRFRWAPAAGQSIVEQYLDLGSDTAFTPGSYLRLSLPVQVSDYDRAGIRANAPYHYRVVSVAADGSIHNTEAGLLVAECGAAGASVRESSADDDYISIPARGIYAAIDIANVGADGVLHDPLGPVRAMRYNFSLWPTLGGYPGEGGTTVIAGHLNYYEYGLAVFAPLREVELGDEVFFERGDGLTLRYVIDWYDDLPADYNWNSLMERASGDGLLLITCNGVFDYEIRRYLSRRVVYAVLVN